MTGGRKSAAWLLWRSGRGVTLVVAVVGGLFSDFWFGADARVVSQRSDCEMRCELASQTARQPASQARPGTYLL